ncbi:MAG: HAD-IIB family hydrolase [Clostridia bacterium]|jgi:sucrose-6F-phosphate phosphohydrolase|nr:HAD family hydrolase [Clostridia bacterium]MDH7572315.1 HAD-IIB family hydrolase [Clostridia bacterium]
MQSKPQDDLLLVLATDLDDTLVGDPAALAELNSWLALRRRQVFLIYLTGRHALSALNLIGAEALLVPDVLVADAGTTIRYRPQFRRDRVWESRFAERWDPRKIEQIASGIPGLSPQGIRSPWRRSYYLGEEKALALLTEALGCLAVRVVVTGRNVDVLPAAAGKGPALRYLVSRFTLPSEKVFVCGDGGNDLDMLQLNYRGVLVGNGSLPPSLLPPTVYRASKPYAAGILEALRHFGLAP